MFTMSTALLRAPKGKTRVIGIDLFEDNRYLVGDFQDEDEACDITDDLNEKRSSRTDDIFRAYDDQGRCIRTIN